MTTRQEQSGTTPAIPEGATKDRSWRLSFRLVARNNPDLFVTPEEVWKVRGRSLNVGGCRFDDPREKLLSDLGRASRFAPALEAALSEPAPCGVDLDSHNAHRFLREGAPALEAAGFKTLLPGWWSAGRARLGVMLVATPDAEDEKKGTRSRLGLQSLCRYAWRIVVGDAILSVEELRALAQQQGPLVQVRGRWVEVVEDELRGAISHLESHPVNEPLPVLEALRVGLQMERAPAGLPILGVDGEGWIGELLRSHEEARVHAIATPAGFRGSLRPYQERGLAWLVLLDKLGLGACLADDMGLGKTIQLLALLLVERELPDGVTATLGPTLIVCPMSVVGNWRREIERFTPALSVYVHHGQGRLDGDVFSDTAANTDVVITTYGLVARDLDRIGEVPWDRIVLDEAQHIKNAATKQSRAVRSLTAARRVALTGTPIENRLTEFWSIMDFLNPGLLGSQRGFQRNFARPIERNRKASSSKLLQRLTAPFLLRRVKTDPQILNDLPDKIEMKSYCHLTCEQAGLYKKILDDLLAVLGSARGMARRGIVLAALTRLKQICNHPAQLLKDGSPLPERSGKLIHLEEIVETVLESKEKLLCFTQFAAMGHLLKAHLEERFNQEVLFLHGGTPRPQRDAMVARFQAETQPALFVLSLRAGGTGLNLTAASHVVHFDRWWNPAVEDQATDRAHRIGQRRTVQVRKLICIGTLEERIDQLIQEKQALRESVVGGGEAWLTELSTNEIREVLRLSVDTITAG